MGSALRTLEQGGLSATLSLISLLVFVTLFVGIVYWTMRKSHDDTYERARNLPFEGENDGETQGDKIHE